MGLDVFFRHIGPYGHDPLRPYMRGLAFARWKLQLDICLRNLTPEIADCNIQEFQRSSRIYADQHASGPFYVLADDDMFLPGTMDLAAMVRLLESVPEFAILSAYPNPATINPWTPEDHKPLLTEDIMEHYSVGGLRLCRKGALTDWPKLNGRAGYDAIQCRALRDSGWHVGYARQFAVTHLGEGFSTVW